MNSFSCCPLCAGKPLVRMFPSDHEWLRRCPQCGLGMCNPQPSDAELSEIYSAEYYSQFGYSGGSGDEALGRIKRATYASFLREAERVLGSSIRAPLRVAVKQRRGAEHGSPEAPRLLDVGCGLGYSLLGGEQLGWQAFGLEPHAMAGAGLPAHLSGRIVRGTLDEVTGHGDAETPRGSDESDAAVQPSLQLSNFDLVSLIDVIEHVRDPVATIRQAAALLAPGGVLMMATNSLTSRGARGPSWVHFHRAHLWYFSPKTLSAAVESAGLVVQSVSVAKRVYNLQYVASILAGSENSRLKKMLARVSLKVVPRRLRLASWPALPEGMLLLAKRKVSHNASPLAGEAAL